MSPGNVKGRGEDRALRWFYSRVSEKLKAAESDSVCETVAASLRGTKLSWRLTMPAAVALVIGLVTFVAPWGRPAVSLPVPPAVPVDLAATVANHEMIASQSLEGSDELLTEQGNKRLPPAPVYTASAFILAGPEV